MGATSVTGKGLGFSYGEYKPQNNASSWYYGYGDPTATAVVKPKTYCSAKLGVGNKVVYRMGSSGGSLKICAS